MEKAVRKKRIFLFFILFALGVCIVLIKVEVVDKQQELNATIDAQHARIITLLDNLPDISEVEPGFPVPEQEDEFDAIAKVGRASSALKETRMCNTLQSFILMSKCFRASLTVDDTVTLLQNYALVAESLREVIQYDINVSFRDFDTISQDKKQEKLQLLNKRITTAKSGIRQSNDFESKEKLLKLISTLEAYATSENNQSSNVDILKTSYGAIQKQLLESLVEMNEEIQEKINRSI